MKKTIARNQVAQELANINAKLSELAPKANRPIAVTANKHLEGVGCINDMENFSQLIKANAHVNRFAGTELDEAAAELGLKNDSPKLQGFEVSVWKADIVARVEYLKARAEIKRLSEAKAILERNLSEDDVFNMDMQKALALING